MKLSPFLSLSFGLSFSNMNQTHALKHNYTQKSYNQTYISVCYSAYTYNSGRFIQAHKHDFCKGGRATNFWKYQTGKGNWLSKRNALSGGEGGGVGGWAGFDDYRINKIHAGPVHIRNWYTFALITTVNINTIHNSSNSASKLKIF